MKAAIPSCVGCREGIRTTAGDGDGCATPAVGASASAAEVAEPSPPSPAAPGVPTGGVDDGAPPVCSGGAPQSSSISSVGGGIDGIAGGRPGSGPTSSTSLAEGSPGEDPPLVAVIVCPRLSHPTRAVKLGAAP
ncbi:MAG TPA: hypothetical protein PLU22_18655 [Polyangiaceae bacterium]|nr:hypothetical protein [Polyangiaceae bacterium]